MNIGFDFDKVLINYPPFIPYKFIDFLYKGRSAFENTGKINKLEYRYPGLAEQRIRAFTHAPIFRQPIKKNVEVLKRISKDKKNKTFLISSRFSFLKKRTDNLIEKEKLKKYFNGIYFNYSDRQPHVFKEAIIKTLGIDIYVDDDLDLAIYLSKVVPSLELFWISNKSPKTKLPKNIIQIKDLGEFEEKYL